MNEKRTAPRRRNLKIAHIVISEKAPKLECVIRNISESGALLQVSTTFGIPTTFDLILGDVTRPCRTVWRSETTIGIAFV